MNASASEMNRRNVSTASTLRYDGRVEGSRDTREFIFASLEILNKAIENNESWEPIVLITPSALQ